MGLKCIWSLCYDNGKIRALWWFRGLTRFYLILGLCASNTVLSQKGSSKQVTVSRHKSLNITSCNLSSHHATNKVIAEAKSDFHSLGAFISHSRSALKRHRCTTIITIPIQTIDKAKGYCSPGVVKTNYVQSANGTLGQKLSIIC